MLRTSVSFPQLCLSSTTANNIFDNRFYKDQSFNDYIATVLAFLHYFSEKSNGKEQKSQDKDQKSPKNNQGLSDMDTFSSYLISNVLLKM